MTAGSGWMTARDAELFSVLARGLTRAEREQLAEAITRVDDRADRQARAAACSPGTASTGSH